MTDRFPGTVGRMNSGRLVLVRRVTSEALHLISLPEDHGQSLDDTFYGGKVFTKSPHTEIEVVDISTLSEINRQFITASMTSHMAFSQYVLKHGVTFPGAVRGELVPMTDSQFAVMSEWFERPGAVRIEAKKKVVIEPVAVIEDPIIEETDDFAEKWLDAISDEDLSPMRRPIFEALKANGLTEFADAILIAEKCNVPGSARWHIEMMVKAGNLEEVE